MFQFNKNFMKNILKKIIPLFFLIILGCNNPSINIDSSNIKYPNKIEKLITTPKEINTKALQHFLDGEMYLSQGDYSMAVIEFQDALRYDALSSAIYLSLAEVLLRLNKFERAEEILIQALELNDSIQEIRELLAQQYLMRGDINLGEKEYIILEASYPKEIQYSYILAEILYRKGNTEKARDKFWNIYVQDSYQVQALSRVAELSKIIGDEQFSFNAFEKLVLLQPENLQFWKNYSELASSLQLFDKAINGLNNLSRLTSDDPIVKERLGILYFENNEYIRSDSILTDLYNKGERSPSLLYYKTRISILNNDFNNSEIFSTEQIQLYPNEVSGYTNLAITYINIDNSFDAIAILLKAKKKFPRNFSINYMLGSTYNNEKKFTLAIESLNKALDLDPNSRSTKHLLANVHNSIGDWSISENIYKELIKSDQKDAQALNNYSYTLAERGLKLKEALNMSQKANELEPNNAAFLDTMGWVFYKLKKYNKAINYIQKSVSLNPNNIVVLEHLGDVYMKINKPDDAKLYYNKILDIDKNNFRIKDKLDN